MTEEETPPMLNKLKDAQIHKASGITMQQGRQLVALAAENEKLREALRKAVYEATHLSPQEPDGSHWAKMSREWLMQARAALTQQGGER